MYKGEVRSIQDMIEVVIVVVHLRGRELALVHNVLGGERADVEAFCERAGETTRRQRS